MAFGIVDDDLMDDFKQPMQEEGSSIGVASKENTATTEDPNNSKSIPNEEHKKSS